MENADHSGQTLVNYLCQSLALIKNVNDQLCQPSKADATPADLVSRIKLCNILLWEISGIRGRLARDLSLRASPLTPEGRASRH